MCTVWLCLQCDGVDGLVWALWCFCASLLLRSQAPAGHQQQNVCSGKPGTALHQHCTGSLRQQHQGLDTASGFTRAKHGRQATELRLSGALDGWHHLPQHVLTCLTTPPGAEPAGHQASLSLLPTNRRKQLSRSYDLGENAALARAVESSPDALMVCDTSQAGWRVLLVNENWVKATGQAARARSLLSPQPPVVWPPDRSLSQRGSLCHWSG